jgi:hypothetical protein
MRSCAAVAISCFLIERIRAIYVPIYGVTSIDGVECLSVVVAQSEVMDVLGYIVDQRGF